MSTRTILMLVLALVFGTAAAVGVSRLRRDSGPREEMVSVVVAATEVPRFTTLNAEMVKTRDYPKSLVPAGAITRVEDVLDRVTDTPLTKDEPVIGPKLSERGAGRGMAAVIPKGKRAVTIQTPNIASGVAGFVLPGNRVDVLFTMKTHEQNDPTGGGSTVTLLQNVEILAVNQRIEAPSENKVDLKELKSVTLLVTPDQAAQIDLAQNLGILHLVLRNPQDTEQYQPRVATLKGIRRQQGTSLPEPTVTAVNKKETPPAQAATPVPLPAIRTLRGGVPGQVTID